MRLLHGDQGTALLLTESAADAPSDDDAEEDQKKAQLAYVPYDV